MEAWNAGLRAAMWRLKREVLGPNGTLICNSTPGPYMCDPIKGGKGPIEDCPCDGTNDERGGGNFDHQNLVNHVDQTDGYYALLVHGGHMNEKPVIMPSIPKFLMAAGSYMYHGSGFGYECASDGWLTGDPDVLHAYSAPLGAPLGPANETKGCAEEPKCCAKNVTCSGSCHKPGDFCARSRRFAAGTVTFVNYSSTATCMIWADGRNYSTPGRHKEDGCAQAGQFLTSLR